MAVDFQELLYPVLEYGAKNQDIHHLSLDFDHNREQKSRNLMYGNDQLGRLPAR